MEPTNTALCAIDELRTDEPGGDAEEAEAVEDLRDESGKVQVERGQRLLVVRKAARGLVKVALIDEVGPPYHFVMGTGRVRRIGAAPAEEQPPALSPQLRGRAPQPPCPRCGGYVGTAAGCLACRAQAAAAEQGSSPLLDLAREVLRAGPDDLEWRSGDGLYAADAADPALIATADGAGWGDLRMGRLVLRHNAAEPLARALLAAHPASAAAPREAPAASEPLTPDQQRAQIASAAEEAQRDPASLLPAGWPGLAREREMDDYDMDPFGVDAPAAAALTMERLLAFTCAQALLGYSDPMGNAAVAPVAAQALLTPESRAALCRELAARLPPEERERLAAELRAAAPAEAAP